MTELLAFFSEHWFLAWCALWIVWMPYMAVAMLLRFIAICVVREWPPRSD